MCIKHVKLILEESQNYAIQGSHFFQILKKYVHQLSKTKFGILDLKGNMPVGKLEYLMLCSEIHKQQSFRILTPIKKNVLCDIPVEEVNVRRYVLTYFRTSSSLDKLKSFLILLALLGPLILGFSVSVKPGRSCSPAKWIQIEFQSFNISSGQLKLM